MLGVGQGLRVGLTGGLGSGKSTVGAMLRELGAHVIESDAVGRKLMERGEPVYREIIQHFGNGVVREDGTLDRRALAELAFQGGRHRELSLLVHPAVIAAQEEWMRVLFDREPGAIAVVESALIFEAQRDGTVPDWRKRFDTVILVTAPRQLKIARHIARAEASDPQRIAALTADAEARIAAQIPDEEKIPLSDIVIENGASLEDTREAVRRAWSLLSKEARLQGASTSSNDERNVS
jgi:dephospho-CoA kinase